MQNTVEYTGVNKRVSPATVELLIHERSRGKNLRQLGQMFNRSHESIRQVLAKHGSPQVTLLPEARVAAKLGYPVTWLVLLRKKGVIKPIKPGGYWLYTEQQVRQIPSLIVRLGKHHMALSAAAKKRWQDPEYRTRQVSAALGRQRNKTGHSYGKVS